MYWFSLNWRMSVGAECTPGIERLANQVVAEASNAPIIASVAKSIIA